MAEKIASLTQERYYPFFVLVFCAVLYLPALGARDLWAPVEPRYAEVVRMMFAKGEWIVPTVNGALYTDKPILFFWLALLAANLSGGVSEWALRLPAALGAVGFVLVTYFIGHDFYSPRIGALAALILATSFRVIWEARWAHVDTLFGFFFVLTIYFGARVVLRRGKPNEILLAYIFMALATLTKGLIGIVLPGLILMAFMLARRDWTLIRLLQLPRGVPLFLLVATPWFYLVNRASDGKWLSDFVSVHHLWRYTAGTGHRQPFYYYLTTLPVDFLPWTAFVIPAALHRPYRPPWNDARTQLFLLWFAVVLIFFSVSATKRDLYLLPLFPPLALLAANYLNDLAAQDWQEHKINLWLPLTFFALVTVSGVPFAVATWAAHPDIFGLLLPAIVMTLGGLATIALIRWGHPLEAAASVGVMMLSLTAAIVFWVFPYLEDFKSHRQFSAEINRQVAAAAALYVYQDTTHDFNYYTERERIPVLETPAEIAKLRGGLEKSYLLIKARALQKLPSLSEQSIAARSTLGSTTWYLLALGEQ